MTRFAGFLVAFWFALTLIGLTPANSAVQTIANSPSINSSQQELQNPTLASEPIAEDIKPPPPPVEEDLTEPDPNQPTDNETPPQDEVSVGEIPVVKMVDLTLDTAQRAVDAYVLLKDKYKDAALENFDSLQDFVDRDPQGKAFEADVKNAGFSNVDEWNQTVTTVSAAYSNIIDDQSTDINLQIDDVQKDTEMAQDMKDRIIASLKALIPTENNRKIVQQLINNPAYTEKLKQLETEEE